MSTYMYIVICNFMHMIVDDDPPADLTEGVPEPLYPQAGGVQVRQ